MLHKTVAELLETCVDHTCLQTGDRLTARVTADAGAFHNAKTSDPNRNSFRTRTREYADKIEAARYKGSARILP